MPLVPAIWIVRYEWWGCPEWASRASVVASPSLYATAPTFVKAGAAAYKYSIVSSYVTFILVFQILPNDIAYTKGGGVCQKEKIQLKKFLNFSKMLCFVVLSALKLSESFMRSRAFFSSRESVFGT